MNFIKLHKICFALAIGAISALCAIKDTGATYKNAKGYTIREMMERRSNGKRSDMAKKATIKKDKVRKSKVKKSPVKTSSEINVVKNKSLPVNVDENVSEQITVQNNVTKKKSGFFDFNSGPLFDTGSCATNNKSGPLFDAGPCKRCQSGPLIDTGPCETCKKPEPRIANYTVDYKEYVYQAVARNCCDMAPIYLDHVDFNLSSQSDYLPYSNKMGNYRFRIFGCRRYDKEAILNQGRVLEKNMNFSKVFEEQTADCYNIVKMPQDLCLQNTPSPLPEYILSAEITDFFMNVCDGYDWQQSQKEEKRTGSAEIKVTWKLTNLTKTKVIWEGETYGYSDLTKGDATGEIALVEKAFADAVSNLRNKAGFEDKLMVRLTPEELTNERNALIDEEIALNPAKCQFKEEQNMVKNCQITREGADLNQCPAVIEQTVIVEPCEQCQGCKQCEEKEVEPCPVCAECTQCESKIIEDSGVLVAHSVTEAPKIIEDSGVLVAHSVTEAPKIIEDSGVLVAHSVTEAPKIIEDSGVLVAHSVTEAPKIIEDSGVLVAHSVTEAPKIIEDSGITSDSIIFRNCIDENGGVVSGGNCVVVDDTWIDMKNGDTSFDSLCIVDRPAYDVLSPENLYKVRASIVEIKNAANQKAAGLVVSENFVITSANIIAKDSSIYNLKTINGKELTGRAVRVNLSKNTALIMLDEETEYTPLSLNLDLPKVGQNGYLTLGILNVDNFEDGENYIDNDGKIAGYRYSEDKGSEIMVDTFVQHVTIGGVLIDGHGTINGLAHTGKKTENGMDLFLPTETALRSLGLSICEKLYDKSSPWQQTVYKPVTELIMNSTPKAPEEMKEEERK